MTRGKSAPKSILSEYAGADFGDKRLTQRLEKVVTRVASNPAGGFPTAVETVAEREALYRFLANPSVSLEAVLAPHVRQAGNRCGEVGEVLVAVDLTELAFRGEAEREGLDTLSEDTQGFEAFFALAVTPTPQRVPLGLLAVEPLFEKQGRKAAPEWSKVVKRAAAALPSSARPVFVMDREADAFELLAGLRKLNHAYIVRAQYDRLVDDGDLRATLRGAVERSPAILEREVPLSRRSGKGKPPDARRRNPPRTARTARLELRACQVVLPCPPKLRTTSDLASMPVNVVLVSEVDTPEGEQPVEWLLLTNEPVGTPEEVERVVDGYRARWRIEEYFKALKTGCGYESRQLESAKTLLAALGLLAPIAWRLLLLQCAARYGESVPATCVLSEVQLKLLRHRSKDIKVPDQPTATDALLALAAIGGHIKQNGPPGWLTIWRGYRKLIEMEAGYYLGRGEM